MDARKFMELLEGSEECAPDRARSIEVVREQLGEDSHCHVFDASGDGTLYRFDGLHFGCAYAEGTVRVLDDGRVVVSVDTGVPVPRGCEPALRRLFLRYNDMFKVPGLLVRDGVVAFETAPFDPEGSYPANRIVGMALCTVHDYVGVPLALEAGARPWDLLDYDSDEDGGDDDDDDDGDPGLSLDDDPGSVGDSLMSALRRLFPSEEATAL